MLEAFSAALETERRKIEASDPRREIVRLQQRLGKAESARKAILDAIEDGAPFAFYRARSEEVEAEIADLEQALHRLRAKVETAAAAMPEAAVLFAGAIERMEQLLGDPDLVDQANQFLRQIIRRIVLVPDAQAEHGLSIKLETDFAALLAPELDGIAPSHLVC